MAGVVVQNTVTDPGGNPYALSPVRIKLITSVSGGAGYTTTGDIVGQFTTTTDATGHWSATLTPNTSITPASTYYQVVEGGAVSNISVPASGGPYELSSILVTAPSTPSAPGITGVQVAANGTVAGSRPEVNVIAGSNVTVSAVDNSTSNRVDLTVSASGGAPASTVQPGTSYGVASAVGVDTTFAREDHQHGTPSLTTTAPATTEGIGQAAAAGTATTPARADHVHPMAAAGAPGNSAVGDAAATGSATTFAASDHRHGRESFGAPGNSAVGDTATAGTSTSVAHADHVHGRESFGTVTALSTFGTASANGTAVTVSHSDHVHGAPALPTASTSVAGIIQLDGTASHLQAQGVAVAGSQGLAADSGHTHPLEAWRFTVVAYGAKGDGKISNTGATTASSATVTIGEAVLTAGDVGKAVMVKNALNANNASGQTTAVGTITAVTSSTSFTATWNTTPTQTSTGLQVLWASDDTSAIQQAITAANTYAQGHAGYAEIFFPTPPGGLYYGVAGALKTTDGTNAVYNSQLTIPVTGEQANGVTLVFRGPEDAGQARYWNTDYPTWNGGIQSFGCFTSSGTQNTSITGGGNPSVIGGPTGKNGYGVLQGVNTTPTYTNTCVVFQDFTVLTTHSNSGWTYSAGNFFGCARFHARNFTYGTNGVVQFYKYTPNLGDFTNVTLLSGGLSIGLILPSNGNNASNYLQNVVCNGGYTFGLFAMEHTVGNSVTVLYSWSGICPVGTYADSGSNAVSALHAMYFDQACVEGCTYHVNIIGAGASGIGPIVHMVLDTEGTVQLRDAVGSTLANTGAGLAAAMGEIRLVGSPSTITVQTGTGAGGLGTGLRIIKEQNLPGVPSSGIPALVDGTAVSNTLWRPATVYLSGGTNVTTVAVSRLAGGVNTVATSNVISQAAGAVAANTPVRLGPGQWIKVTTSAGTLPTAVWVLD